MFALVTAPVEPLTKSTCGIDTKFVPVILIVVAVAGAIVCELFATVGFVSVAYAWIKVVDVSFKDYNENKNFYEDKINTAKFYFDKVLPRAEQHYKSAISGSSNIMNFKFN